MKMKHCAFCGDELGPTDDNDREPEACGKRECRREVRGMFEEQRQEAHERLDRDLGYL